MPTRRSDCLKTIIASLSGENALFEERNAVRAQPICEHRNLVKNTIDINKHIYKKRCPAMRPVLELIHTTLYNKPGTLEQN